MLRNSFYQAAITCIDVARFRAAWVKNEAISANSKGMMTQIEINAITCKVVMDASGIYNASYGEVTVSVEKCVEIKGDYVEK